MFLPPYGEENQIVLSRSPLQENTDCIKEQEQDAALHQDATLVKATTTACLLK